MPNRRFVDLVVGAATNRFTDPDRDQAAVPAVLSVALRVRRARLFNGGAGGLSVFALGGLVAIGSMHHETAYAGGSPEQLPRFALLLAGVTLGAFLLAWFDGSGPTIARR